MEVSKLRAFQDQMANAGWRIQLIPYDDPSKPMMIQTNWYALAGMLGFLGGIGFYFLKQDRVWLYVAVAGLIFACFGLLVVGRNKRRGWKQLKAVCVDREHRRIRTAGGASTPAGHTWAFRLLCRLEFEGKEYSVTPVFWRTFGSEEGLLAFLGKTINEDGTCVLYVNPRNPLQTELSGDDVADKLLH